jgi:DNA-damage-inducible protein D
MADPSAQVSPFDAIRHEDEAGEYWSARELAPVLEYSRWQRFQPVIAKAETACAQSGYAVSDHFTHVGTVIEVGKGAQREIEDVQLSRYACYLIVQNGDPSKPVIAHGQTYFAIRTREAELAAEAVLQGMTEDQQRLYIRTQMADHNKQLAEAAHAAGIPSGGFGIFQNHGYKGLYNGETAAAIAKRKGLRKGQEILDHMGSTELAANLFRATQAEDKLRRSGPDPIGQEAANAVHFEVGRKVRQTIAELGGTMPEDLPTPAASIQQLRVQEQKRIEAERQPSLFGDTPPEED